MREVPLRHEVIRLNNAIEVGAVDSDGDPHDEVLRPLYDASVEAEQV
jgi:hypothetical protein